MPNDKKAYAQREKAYMQGKLFPQIKVGMTKVNLTPTVVKDERGIPHTEAKRSGLHLRYQRSLQRP